MATKKIAVRIPIAKTAAPSGRTARMPSATGEVPTIKRKGALPPTTDRLPYAIMGGPVEQEDAAFPSSGMFDGAQLIDTAADLPPEEKNPTIHDFQARMFRLHRDDDHTGSTGEGVVAEGVEWTDGTVTVRWNHGDTTQHSNLKTLATMHFNRGSTKIVWM